MEFYQTVWIAIGASVAALIAASVTFVSIITSKEQKTSEFRQAWIDRTRDEIGRYLTLLVTLRPVQKTDEEKQLYLEMLDRYHQLKLRMNPNPKKDVELKRLLDESFDDFHSIETRSRLLAERRLQVLSESQEFFKNEWEIVKKGESIYRNTKYTPLLLIIICALLITFGLTVGGKDKNMEPNNTPGNPAQKSPNQTIQPPPDPLPNSKPADG